MQPGYSLLEWMTGMSVTSVLRETTKNAFSLHYRCLSSRPESSHASPSSWCASINVQSRAHWDWKAAWTHFFSCVAVEENDFWAFGWHAAACSPVAETRPPAAPALFHWAVTHLWHQEVWEINTLSSNHIRRHNWTVGNEGGLSPAAFTVCLNKRWLKQSGEERERVTASHWQQKWRRRIKTFPTTPPRRKDFIPFRKWQTEPSADRWRSVRLFLWLRCHLKFSVAKLDITLVLSHCGCQQDFTDVAVERSPRGRSQASTNSRRPTNPCSTNLHGLPKI